MRAKYMSAKASEPKTSTKKAPAVLAAELIIHAIGENGKRDGLQRTPQRFAKAIQELCSGYALTAEEAVGNGVFPAEGRGLVSVRKVEFHSLCEHHMLPFWGEASVAYYPAKKILGLSKIPRLVDVFSKRLQVQERLTNQIAEAISQVVQPRAVAVRVTGCHMCMMMRGVKKQKSDTITESSLGLENLSQGEIDRLWKSLD